MSWIQHPIEIHPSTTQLLTAVGGMDHRLKEALNANGYEFLMAPQKAIWEICCGGLWSEHDICLCFPTGSGKTLAYVLPIINALLQSPLDSVHCLRALIVLPTKTLLNQVSSVMAPYCDRLGVRIGFIGQDDISKEMELLKSTSSSPFNGVVDILLATPGRLLTHLDHTFQFSLKTLQFMVGYESALLDCVVSSMEVLDEADHLMKRRHRGCLPSLFNRLRRDTATRGIGGSLLISIPDSESAKSGVSIESRVLKIIVSATVSRDLNALKRMELCRPRMICTEDGRRQRYQFPDSLKHVSVTVPAPLCPLAVIGLLYRSPLSKTIIFASTKNMSQKIAELLQNIPFLKGKVLGCSGILGQKLLNRTIRTFKHRCLYNLESPPGLNNIPRKDGGCVLVASDVVARGIDVDDVEQVINYDTPVHVKTYLHRVGRTARVDRSGVACSLLRKGIDEKPFGELIHKLSIVVEAEKLDVEELKKLKPEVDAALNVMRTRRTRESKSV